MYYLYLKLSFNSQFQAYVPDKWVRDVSRFERIGFVYKPPRACGLSFLNPQLKLKKKKTVTLYIRHDVGSTCGHKELEVREK